MAQFIPVEWSDHILSFLPVSDIATLLDIPLFRSWAKFFLCKGKPKQEELDILVCARLERRQECKTWCKANYIVNEYDLNDFSTIEKRDIYNKNRPIQLFSLADVVKAVARRESLSICGVIEWKLERLRRLEEKRENIYRKKAEKERKKIEAFRARVLIKRRI